MQLPSHLTAVDIVILSWGRVKDTLAAIESCLLQNDVTINIIIIDQGTKSDELDMIKSRVAGLHNVTLICNAKNTGVPEGRNQGASIGSAPYIVALDNDAEFAGPDEIIKAVRLMEEDAKIAALAFRIVLYDGGGDDRSSWPYPLAMGSNAGRRFETTRFVGAGHLLRRTSFDRVGGYDGALVFLHEEVDLAYRLLNLNMKIVYDPSVKIRHKVSTENRVTWSDQRYYYHIRNKIYISTKYNFSLLPAFLINTVAIFKGLRSGYIRGTLKGIISGLTMVPRALNQRWFNEQVRLSDGCKTYIRNLSPTGSMTFTQKLRYRIAEGRTHQK